MTGTWEPPPIDASVDLAIASSDSRLGSLLCKRIGRTRASVSLKVRYSKI